jgi:hypothetical protein
MGDHKGMAAGAATFVIWGLLPVYWKGMVGIPAYEILCHRMAWSLLVTLGLLAANGGLAGFFSLWRQQGQLLYFLLTSLILSANWLIYIWAVKRVTSSRRAWAISSIPWSRSAWRDLPQGAAPVPAVVFRSAGPGGGGHLTFLYGAFPGLPSPWPPPSAPMACCARSPRWRPWRASASRPPSSSFRRSRCWSFSRRPAKGPFSRRLLRANGS